jgi:hypothetical protein
MKTYKILLALFFLPGIVFSQGDTKRETYKEVKKEVKKEEKSPVKLMANIPSQAQYSETFAIKNVDFNKMIDYTGKGEILEVQFILENLTDDPLDVYIFSIATFEKVEKSKSSRERPIPATHRVRSFVPYPYDITNFQYPETDQKGNILRDERGVEKLKLAKFPKNPKAGVDPGTGKPYHLTDKLVVRTRHLSKYRQNYFFFNEVALLVFDSEGKPAFRQLYQLRGKRGR